MTSLLQRFNNFAGPGVLAGVTLGDWLRLLADNGFRVHPAFLPRAMTISYNAVNNSFAGWVERLRYGKAVENVTVPPPLFVLGHWRSGTTLLHDLLSLDDRFAFPNLFQVMYPHAFLTTEAVGSRIFRLFSPKHRPHDNMKLDPAAAWEDEFVLCACEFLSCYLTWTFPRRAAHYDRYLSFRDAPPDEVERWRRTLLTFLKKLTLKYGKPLVLKSPTHTCRVKLLLEMFPDARFVHIRRNPYAVFRSTVHTHQKVHPMCRLQRDTGLDWAERVTRQYREVCDAYFAERGLIPPGRLHEVSFEELEKDPVGQVRGVYEGLGLPDFGHAEPALRRYVESVAGYRKNVFTELPPDMRQRVAREWRRSFEEWGYPA